MLKYTKYIKTLRHVSISTDHHQGVHLYLVKVTELFKNTEFKILKIILGVVAVLLPQENLHENYQCRMYSGKLLMMGIEDARNM